VTLNCGYGHGFSVREVVERQALLRHRLQGRNRISAARVYPAQIIAASDRIRATLAWPPQYDDLAAIIAHALAWEQRSRQKLV